MNFIIRLVAANLALFCLALPAEQTQAATAGTVKAELHLFTHEYRTYARVEPQTLVVIKAATTGVITDLRVLPGEQVHAGELLAKLTGADYRTNLSAAVSRRDAARSNLAVTQKNYPQFSSAQDVSNAEAAFDEAESALKRLKVTGQLVAPAEGIVLGLNTADGERVTAGQSLITLQPSRSLWLRAQYYGADVAAIRVGMSGEFFPADASSPVPVKVATVFGALLPDGGESVGLLTASSAPTWINGEFGTVVLKGPPHKLVAVPTRALILDGGRWWLLVHTAHGDRHQAVVPGLARGWMTFIEHGLEPGADVVVANAYLKFYRGISTTYTPPN